MSEQNYAIQLLDPNTVVNDSQVFDYQVRVLNSEEMAEMYERLRLSPHQQVLENVLNRNTAE